MGSPICEAFGQNLRAIRKSKGKYVVRVDSDDYVSANFLHMLTEFAEQEK